MFFPRPSPLKATLLRELGAAKLRLVLKRGLPRTHSQNPPSQRLSFGIVSQTLKGDLVRSKAEKHIADFLFRRKIQYEYEPHLKLGTKTVRPDFYLPDQGVYIEFWGLVSQPEYVARMRWKLRLYHQFRIKLVSLYQTDLTNMEEYLINKLGVSR